jgi:hypothetical protein
VSARKTEHLSMTEYERKILTKCIVCLCKCFGYVWYYIIRLGDEWYFCYLCTNFVSLQNVVQEVCVSGCTGSVCYVNRIHVIRSQAFLWLLNLPQATVA